MSWQPDQACVCGHPASEHYEEIGCTTQEAMCPCPRFRPRHAEIVLVDPDGLAWL